MSGESSSDPRTRTRQVLSSLVEHERERGALGPEPDPPRLTRFEILERLGAGATAVVYRAKDRELNRPVAVKVLRTTAGWSEMARERFRREARTAAGLAHPNIVAVYDAGEEQGQLYMVMELVEGRPLSEHLKREPFDEKAIAGLLEKAARGVAAAHLKGIVHRDLKPANILVTASGEPKVGDFGLAHLAEAAELTATGAVMGTPLYMAPEQVGGRTKEVTPRTDVYALGAVLYEAVTGRPPHPGESVPQIFAAIVGEEPLPPRKANPKLSRPLEAVLQKALEKDPDRRYPTAEGLAEDLSRFLRGEAPGARPISGPARLWRRGAKYRAMAIASFAAVAIGIVLGSWAAAKAVRWSMGFQAALAEAARREKEGRLEEALEAYRAALALDAAHADARQGFARTEAELRRLRDTEEILLRYDFEDGKRPREFDGAVRLVAGPPREGNRYCLHGEDPSANLSMRKMIVVQGRLLVRFRCYVEWGVLKVRMLEDKSKKSAFYTFKPPAHGRWVQATIPFDDFATTQGQKPVLNQGDVVWHLMVTRESGGGAAWYDDVEIIRVRP